jgi:hypothetical protein
MLAPSQCAHAWWSIYIRTSNKRKLLPSHVPPVNVALEHIEFAWHITAEPENPGLFRLVNYQNFEFNRVEDVVLPVIRRA